MVKNPPANAGDLRDMGSIPGSGRSLGEGNGNPLKYFCLENPMDCSPPGFSVHGISQARILEWVAISFSIKLINSMVGWSSSFSLRSVNIGGQTEGRL